MVKYSPILFNTDMVRAVLSGSKTQTRRPLKAGFPLCSARFDRLLLHPDPKIDLQALFEIPGDDIIHGVSCPFGKTGDFLWIRETIRKPQSGETGRLIYRADVDDESAKNMRWTPSIHMPRSACRTVLEIRKIRVQRIQQISSEDALTEGMAELDGKFHSAALCATAEKYGLPVDDPRCTFAHLWDTAYAGQLRGWQKNPFVWVIDFKRQGEVPA